MLSFVKHKYIFFFGNGMVAKHNMICLYQLSIVFANFSPT